MKITALIQDHEKIFGEIKEIFAKKSEKRALESVFRAGLINLMATLH